MAGYSSMYPKRWAICIVAVLLCAAPISEAKQKKQQAKRLPPKIVLVQLSSESNRMRALMEAGRTNEIEILKKDVDTVLQLTVNDFSDFFQFCPLYFYMDTNAKAVMSKQFEGVLLDAYLQPVNNIPQVDTNLLIVYYGRPTWQSKKRKMETTTMGTMSGSPYGTGLIICNHEMKQVGFSDLIRSVPVLSSGKKVAYRYESKKFDIIYHPVAEEFDALLRKLGQ